MQEKRKAIYAAFFIADMAERVTDTAERTSAITERISAIAKTWYIDFKA